MSMWPRTCARCRWGRLEHCGFMEGICPGGGLSWGGRQEIAVVPCFVLTVCGSFCVVCRLCLSRQEPDHFKFSYEANEYSGPKRKAEAVSEVSESAGCAGRTRLAGVLACGCALVRLVWRRVVGVILQLTVNGRHPHRQPWTGRTSSAPCTSLRWTRRWTNGLRRAAARSFPSRVGLASVPHRRLVTVSPSCQRRRSLPRTSVFVKQL